MSYFTGKRAVITGAGSGIGRGLALELAKRGAHLVICDNRKETLEETVKMLPKEATKTLITKVIDVANRDQVHDLAAEVEKAGGADIVINNAGVAQIARVEELTYDDLAWVMDVNYWGMVYGTMAFLPQIRAKGKGHILNVSSVFGLFSVPGQAAYNSSKFAIRGFTEALREEMREDAPDIHIAAIHPGGINTNIVRNARLLQAQDTEEERERMATQFLEFVRTEPEGAAEVILRGMEKRKGRILIGRDARFMDRLVRLFPVRYSRLMRWGNDNMDMTKSPEKEG